MQIKVLTSLLLLLTSAAATAADVDWSGWSFDYSTNNNLSGLVLTDVRYNNKEILGKVSMPVMRVEYENDICGPFADILSAGVLRNPGSGAQIQACENQALCLRTFTQNGENMFEIGANWQIGEYQIYQTYYFSENGYFDSRVYSRGLQCQSQHTHHAHWMFDFDIDGAADDQIAKNENDVQLSEFNDLKTNSSFWTIQDKNTGSKVRLTPADDDGQPDNFSKWDLAGRAFVTSEVSVWRHGARGEIGELFNTPAQNIDGADVVLWYVSHLPHSAEEGESIWHASGPRLTVLDETPVVPQPDTQPELQPEPEPQPDTPGNQLTNGSFDSGSLAGWDNCGSAAAVELVSAGQNAGAGAVRIFDGGCLFQQLAAQPQDTLLLNCFANLSGSGWTIIELSYLDSNFENLATEVRQITPRAGFNDYAVYGEAPDGTAYAAALLYSESDTVFDTCALTPAASMPVPAEPVGNQLFNGDFENGLSNWNSCSDSGLLSIGSDADTGQAALEINNAGCAFQQFPIAPGNTYRMTCRAKSEGDQLYSSVSLTLLDSDYVAVENSEVEVDSTEFNSFSTFLTAPIGSSFGSVVVYSEDAGQFDNCRVFVN